MKANFVLLYNNPDVGYVWAYPYDTYEEAKEVLKRLCQLCQDGSRKEEHFSILADVDPNDVVRDIVGGSEE